MYKIAHISDSHISYDDENGHGKRLVELLTDIKGRDCSHIVVTGDLVENPDVRDLQLVREIFAKFGLLDFSKMSVIPGNHDIFGGAPNGKMFFEFPLTCKETNYGENKDKFIDAFKETFPSNNSFPYLKIIENIALIGVNSVDAWSEEKNPEGSNGRITKKDLKKIKKILSSEELNDKYKIVLIHHHFYKPVMTDEYPAHSLWLKIVNWKMRLYGRNKIISLFKNKK
ncbi:MAG: metallophosphoesterase [Ignavibacteria bacterium]|nr:metallophosphoesterase [Ignavibacteria bacterium]